MDLYSYDQKLSELGEHDFNDMLEDQDVFSTRNVITESYGMNDDWLDSFFEDPVLNDRMISEAIESPQIKSEHSYSLSKNGQRSESPNSLTDTPKEDKEMETDLILTQTMNPNTNMIQQVKEEPQEHPEPTTQTFIATTASSLTNSQQSLIKQPTIILATQQNVQNSLVKQESLVLPNVNVKLEPASPVSSHGDQSIYDCMDMDMPPTPPSSTNSDSEGGQSPQRSAPSSPVRPMNSLRQGSLRALSSQPLFTSPIPTSGVLVLSEEEKRTLISEGYPIPSKLPLTKQEEKNLKKIRRKIKNKISAQESRRKKKEYLETLEKRVESFSSENSDLRKKVDSLENNNRSLLSQLQKLQALVGKATTTSQTGTCLMVLVLCFAVFVGCWSPINFANVGYGSVMQSPLPMTQAGIGIPMGPEVKDAVVETYTTPKMRSRVLLSTEEEAELEHYGPHAPFSYKTIFSGIFPSVMNVDSSEGQSAVMQPPMPEAEVTSQVVEKETTHRAEIAANIVAVDARTTQNATA